MTSERLVFDTNVLISGLIWPPSAPGRALDHAAAYGQLVASVELLDEVVTTLLSAKFDAYVRRAEREMLIQQLIPVIELVESVQAVRACRDPRDDKFLEAAVNGNAGVIVTGDKDLLVLHPFAGVDIITPAAYLERVQENA